MEECAYLAVAINETHDSASLVEIRCFRPDLLNFEPFQELAQAIAQLLIDCESDRCPRYLDRSNIPEEEIAKLREECRLEALRRGIPRQDIPEYAAGLWQERMKRLCLNEFIVGERSVASHLNQFSKRFGEVCIARFKVDRVRSRGSSR